MSEVQVPVASLRQGMYVSALDRPWVGTPFLFQGFVIQDDEQLSQLRGLCDFVVVDEELSCVPVPRNPLPVHGARAPAPGTDAAVRRRMRLLRRNARAGYRHRQTSHGYVRWVLHDSRLGRSVDAEEAREVVGVLVDSIAADAAAALWLTHLKNRDEYTSLHCINVCVLTVAFCRELGYADEDLKTIGLGALLHDIGKAWTPLEILNKPGRLTDDEFRVIRRHPEDGYQIMKDTGQVPAEALAIIRYHHERLNGRGYPDGLRSHELTTPVLATAIADVYDALTSDRVYHAGRPSDAVLRMMYEDAGGSFGRELMEGFIRCVGIYPVGSLVELESGAIGLVVSVEPDSRLLPEVLLLRDADGRPLEEPMRISLADKVAEAVSSPWVIRRVVRGEQVDIDPAELLLREIGVGLSV